MANGFGGLATVHARHLHVHQYQIEAVLLDRLQRGRAVVHRHHVGTHVAEQSLDQQEVGRIVVDAEHLGGAAGAAAAGSA